MVLLLLQPPLFFLLVINQQSIQLQLNRQSYVIFNWMRTGKTENNDTKRSKITDCV